MTRAKRWPRSPPPGRRGWTCSRRSRTERTMARIAAVSSHRCVSLNSGWQMCAPEHPLGAPTALEKAGVRWLDAKVPGTAAGVLRDAGLWNPEVPLDFDDREFWWRCRFPGDPGSPGKRVLHFD